MISNYVADLEGLSINYLRAGSGKPLLLLHGWPEWSHVWKPVIQRLRSDFDLIAPDFRGFGDSEKTSHKPATDASPENLANDLYNLLDKLNIPKVGLVSHDVGSFVAQVFARSFPERVSGLFFFNCAYPGIGARWLEPDHLLETWYQFFHQLPWVAELIGSSRETCRIYIREFLHHWSYQKSAFDEELELWVDNFMQPGNLQGGFNWYLSNHASRMAVIKGTAPAPPPIDLPTRIYWGEHDPLFKKTWTDRLSEYFTDLEFSFASNAGHFVHYETPDEASSEIKQFFTRIGWQ